tara:strand:+ start:4660 stop:5772 length:1113 start_codon:yes stop_codon:yes gene_type:complete
MRSKQLASLIREFYPYAKQYMGFDKDTKLRLADDHKNAEDMLGKTAHYSPRDNEITVFVTNRHPKDILRSISHELVHHKQACDGKFDDLSQMDMGEGYAQSNLYLREMEEEAYLLGNMCFRDWTDQRIQQNSLTEEKKMSKMVKKLEFLAENKKTGVFGDVKVNSKMAKMIVEAHSRLNDKQKTQFESLSIGELVKLVENYISLKENQTVNEEQNAMDRKEEAYGMERKGMADKARADKPYGEKHPNDEDEDYRLLDKDGKKKQDYKDRRKESHAMGGTLQEEQDYDDREDEHLGKHGKESDHQQSYKDRRKEMRAMLQKEEAELDLNVEEEETLQEKTFRLQEAGDRLDEIYTQRENLLYERLVSRWIK